MIFGEFRADEKGDFVAGGGRGEIEVGEDGDKAFEADGEATGGDGFTAADEVADHAVVAAATGDGGAEAVGGAFEDGTGVVAHAADEGGGEGDGGVWDVEVLEGGEESREGGEGIGVVERGLEGGGEGGGVGLGTGEDVEEGMNGVWGEGSGLKFGFYAIYADFVKFVENDEDGGLEGFGDLGVVGGGEEEAAVVEMEGEALDVGFGGDFTEDAEDGADGVDFSENRGVAENVHVALGELAEATFLGGVGAPDRADLKGF